MTDTDKILALGLAAGVFGSEGNKFQERLILSHASDLVMKMPESDQAGHMNRLVSAHKQGLKKD